MSDDLTDFAQRLTVLSAGLGGEAMESVMTSLGVEAKNDALAAARRDLGGDNRFSGWNKAGLGLEVRFDHVSNGVIAIIPTPRSRGPWAVAESGRAKGSKFVKKRGRNYGWGPTRGKDTWTDAMNDVESETPERALTLLYETARGILDA